MRKSEIQELNRIYSHLSSSYSFCKDNLQIFRVICLMLQSCTRSRIAMIDQAFAYVYQMITIASSTRKRKANRGIRILTKVKKPKVLYSRHSKQ